MQLPIYVLLAHLAVGFLFFEAGVAQDTQPSVVTEKVEDYYGFMDAFTGFTCQAGGSNLKYSWKHRDQLITKDYPLKFPEINSSQLKPDKEKLERSYEGFYQCFVENSIGRIFGRINNVKFTVIGEFKPYQHSIQEVLVTIGKPAAIQCPPHRYSYAVSYQWQYKKGGRQVQLEHDPSYFVTENGTLHFAYITQEHITSIDDKGGIRCEQFATYDDTTRSLVSHPIKLKASGTPVNAKFRPQIMTSRQTRNILGSEDEVVLKCGAIGNPVPKLKWYREDNLAKRTEITNANKKDFEMAWSNQDLSIKQLRNKQGVYVCVATNSEGSAEMSNNIFVRDRPQWTTELKDAEPVIDSWFEWNCAALGGPTYKWYKNGVELDDTSAGKYEIRLDPEKKFSTLIIKKVSEEYNGMYQCTASNEKDFIYTTARFKMKVSKPVFTDPMGPITLIVGKEGRIICSVEGSPVPTVFWRKDSQRVVYNDRIKLAPNKLDLLITNVTSADRGVYTCVAENIHGKAEDSSSVSLGSDLTWVSKPVDNTNVTQGLRFELDCEAKGPEGFEVKYLWLRNGLPLEYSARIHWVKEDHRLVMLDSLVSDTGSYTCIAFTDIPQRVEKRHDAMIEVKAPPEPPDMVAVQGDCWNKDAKLVWHPSSYNNEAEMRYTLIEWATTYEPTNWTELQKLEEGGQTKLKRELKLDFDVLPPYSQISFRVILSNRIGDSEPSLPTDAWTCITSPGPPKYPPDEIKGEPGGANVLKLVWTPVRQMYWGSTGFEYVLQFRRMTKDKSESRWSRSNAFSVVIKDGNNNSVAIPNPGYYNLWEFRIQSRNRNGTSEWKRGSSYSGQNAPTGKPTAVTTDRVAARTVDLRWDRVRAERNGSIDGYRIEYWHSVIGVDVDYEKGQQKRRNRKKRDDEEEEEEEEIQHCFNRSEPCVQDSVEKESRLENLRPYQTYHIKIAAYNSGGLGPYSEPLQFETAEDTPGEPYAVLVFAYGQFAKLTWKQPRHMNGKILEYEVSGNNIITTPLPWWMRRHIIYRLDFDTTYEAKLRARTSTGWGEFASTWFQTTSKKKPAKPLKPEVLGYGENGVNVTFMEPEPVFLRKYGGELDEDPWEYRQVGGFENEHHGRGGYPARFYVLYRKAESEEEFSKTEQRQMWGEEDQTWIVIENLEPFTIYEFATVPVNNQGEGPRSDVSFGLPGGIVPKVKKLDWYQRDWFIALCVLLGASFIAFLVILLSTRHLKNIYYEGAPKRRKEREKQKIFEPEDVDGGFTEFTLKSARSSRSVVTSRSGPPPPYSVTNGSTSRHSGDFEDEDLDSDEDDEKHEVSTYYSDDKKVPLDDLDDDDEENSQLATFV